MYREWGAGGGGRIPADRAVGHVRCVACWVGAIDVTTRGVREVLLTAQIGEQSIEDGGDRVQPVLVGTESVADSNLA